MASSGKSIVYTHSYETELIAYDVSVVFSWKIDSQSSEDNTSVVSWELVALLENARPNGPNGYIPTTGYIQCKLFYSVVENTKKIYLNQNYSRIYAPRTIDSGTAIVKHDLTGKGGAFSYEVYIGDWYDTLGTVNETVELDQIDRAAKVSCNNGMAGDIVTISMSHPDEEAANLYVCDLAYTFDGENYFTIADNCCQNYYWTIPASIYEHMPTDSPSCVCTIRCLSYTAGDRNFVGESQCEMVLTVTPDLRYPELSPIVYDVNELTVALTGDNSVFIKGFSTAFFETNAVAKYGASIVEQFMMCGNKLVKGTGKELSGVTSGTFAFHATDDCGYSSSKTLTKALVEYINLTCNLSATETTTDGLSTISVSGYYFNGSFGAVSNTLTVRYRYKKSGGSFTDWVEVTPTISENRYNAETTVSNLDYSSRYTFEVMVSDILMEISKSADNVAIPAFDWGENDFNFNVPVYAGGYNLGGAAKALSNVYTLSASVVSVSDNYTVLSVSGYLVGNILLFTINFQRNTPPSVGLINETIAKVKVLHEGKITRGAGSSGINGYGGLISVSTSKPTVNDTDSTFWVNLVSATTDSTDFVAVIHMPCVLNLDAY